MLDSVTKLLTLAVVLFLYARSPITRSLKCQYGFVLSSLQALNMFRYKLGRQTCSLN